MPPGKFVLDEATRVGQAPSVMTTVTVIGNCQTAPIARLLAALSPGVRVTFAGQVQLMADRDQPAMEAACEAADIIFAQRVASTYPLPFVRTDAVRQAWPGKVMMWPNLHFRAQCPDLHRASLAGRRIIGPLMAYHLRTVLLAWRAGEPASQALSALRDGDGGGAWSEAAAVAFEDLRNRESGTDIVVSDLIAEAWQERPLFFTFDHPRVRLLAPVAERLLRRAGLPIAGEVPAAMGEPLGTVRPPVTPGMRAALGLKWPHEGPAEAPGKPGGVPRRAWPLPQLVDGFYRTYDADPSAAMAAVLS